MKLRFSDRILTVILAVFFLLLAAAIVAESAFGALISPTAVKLLREPGVLWTGIRVVVIILCLVAAWRCLDVSFRRKKHQDVEFVEQKTEGGKLRVAVKAVEGLVRKCVANHEEMTLDSVRLENRKEGLVVIMSCRTAADISIPLAVAALQKQLREYIMESTGVDIHEIQVEVNDAQAELAGGAYRLHDAVIDPEARNAQLQETAAAVPEEPEKSIEEISAAESAPAVPEEKAEESAPAEKVPEAVEETPAEPAETVPEAPSRVEEAVPVIREEAAQIPAEEQAEPEAAPVNDQPAEVPAEAQPEAAEAKEDRPHGLAKLFRHR